MTSLDKYSLALNKITPINQPIRILHIITRMIVGGAQENTMYTAALLDKSRFQVEVICGPQTGSEGSLIEEARNLGVKITIVPELLREVNPLKDLIALIKLYSIIKHNQYALVHTHSSKAGILGRIAAKLAGTPVILHTVHGWSFHDYMPLFKKEMYIFLERLTARFCQRIIVVSMVDQQKGLINKIGKPEQYQLIRSAIPLDQFQPKAKLKPQIHLQLGVPIDAPIVGTISRLSPQKNPLEWVKIASHISDKFPRAYFVIIGDGPLHNEVVDLLRAEGIASKTILTGLRRDVGEFLNAFDIILLTSLWEGLPRVIPEAMSVGIPVVAYAVDGIAEVIQPNHNGILCEPHNLEQAANACIELLQDEKMRQSLRKAGRQTALNHFDLQKMIAELEQLYKASLNIHRG